VKLEKDMKLAHKIVHDDERHSLAYLKQFPLTQKKSETTIILSEIKLRISQNILSIVLLPLIEKTK
jgi:hypothetical protein